MICRLCFCKLTEFVKVFDFYNFNEEFGIITKYFGIEVRWNTEIHVEDAASNKICNTCWKHLDDFHRFWLFIKEKQQTYQDLTNIKCDPLENFKKESSPWEKDDIKDVQLHELSIINESKFGKAELNSEEFNGPELSNVLDSDKDDFISHDGASDDSDYLPKSITKKLKQSTGQRTHCLSLKTQNTSLVKKPRKVSYAKQLKADDNRKLICEVCNKRSANKNALKRHMSRRHPSEQQTILLAKQLTDDNTKLKCKVCDKESANKYALKRHMYRSHPSEQELKFPCNLCIKKFAKKYLLDDHLNRHSAAEKRKTCQICKKWFYSHQELQAHQKSEHAEERKIVCDSCGKGFKTKVGYEYHYKNEHLGITLPEAQCQICKEWLKNRATLVQHMYKHRDESSGTDFVCNICGAVKSTKRKLTCHKRYNHPSKMHKCTLCSKEFKRVLALEEHIAAVHTGQPLYTCRFCPQTFKSNANMYNHRRRLHPSECIKKKISASKKRCDNRNIPMEIEQVT